MPRDRSLRSFLAHSFGGYPPDLSAVVAVVLLLALAVFLPGVRETPLRIVLGLPFVLFVPGYAFIAALFPEAGGESTQDADAASDEEFDGALDAVAEEGESGRRSAGLESGGITGLERVALSFGTSIAIVPLIGLVLNFTPWGIRLAPIVIAVGGFSVVAAWIAAARRAELPEDRRFDVPYERWVASTRAELLAPETRADAALNAVLVLSLLLAAASVTYAVAVPTQGESFTEFYLLTENESGALVADDYPTEFTRGESKQLHVGVGNHEHRPVTYSVVVLLQRVELRNNSTRVLAERELSQYRTFVEANETDLRELTVAPTMTGERLRLQFLLYRRAPPPEPSASNAYRELHLWVNVSAPATSNVRSPPVS